MEDGQRKYQREIYCERCKSSAWVEVRVTNPDEVSALSEEAQNRIAEQGRRALLHACEQQMKEHQAYCGGTN